MLTSERRRHVLGVARSLVPIAQEHDEKSRGLGGSAWEHRARVATTLDNAIKLLPELVEEDERAAQRFAEMTALYHAAEKAGQVAESETTALRRERDALAAEAEGLRKHIAAMVDLYERATANDTDEMPADDWAVYQAARAEMPAGKGVG